MADDVTDITNDKKLLDLYRIDIGQIREDLRDDARVVLVRVDEDRGARTFEWLLTQEPYRNGGTFPKSGRFSASSTN
ncbi:MAG TPA: hypothetical protein VGJ20_00515 [Xanthobacteraceae bacterium]|jgi:hypothetical protein